ncbi:AraC family ligand binding domain-containing protein [Massilia sp. Dwa41.01b]|uniref:AraC-like ligand-binding domain-containing protein n=1 Tax=Massilia sp. Dwa41.01b TaxID=2709302 RepID=UPI001E54A6EA|nr:AraC family ligand binding domain-containing protein [Massilia sp. Dwa41.01b]
MPTLETPSVDLAIRSYGTEPEWDRHAFAQLVLPLSGTVQLEIEGRQGRLDPLHGALVAPGAWHTQVSHDANRSFILDIDGSAMEHDALARLAERPFTPLGPAVRKLVEFMELMASASAVARPLLQGWVPLLLDALALETPQPRSRLAALLARWRRGRACPGRPPRWPASPTSVSAACTPCSARNWT